MTYLLYALHKLVLVATMVAAAAPVPGAEAPTAPQARPAAPSGVPVWMGAYGFVELDMIHDSTQSFADTATNGAVAREGTYAGDHDRTTFSARSSRVGLTFEGPDFKLARSSAVIEVDFLASPPAGVPESVVLAEPGLRVRHLALKVATPVIDILAGQYWQLFGWQPHFHAATAQVEGAAGQASARTPQLRLSRAFGSESVTVELAVAASRPAQRNSGIPDGQAGVRVAFRDWKGVHTAGAVGTAVDAGGVGVSGIYRRFRVAELSEAPLVARSKGGAGVSLDVMVPVIPVASTTASRGNTLTFMGSYLRGTGIADLFVGLTGGLAFPPLPNPGMTVPAPTYVPDIDPGLVSFTPGGGLHTIDWQAFTVGAQYYLPPSGNVWLSANYSQMDSQNIDIYAAGMQTRVFDRLRWADGNLFWNVGGTVRLAAELAWFQQRYVDGAQAQSYRFQLSAFYVF